MRTRVIALTLASLFSLPAAGLANPAGPIDPAPVEGDWIGGFESPDGTIYVAAHFEPHDGRLAGHVDLPLRGDMHIPLASVSASEQRLSFEVRGANGSLQFDGKRRDRTLSGSVRQAFASTSFEMVKLLPVSQQTIADVSGDYELEAGHVILVGNTPSGLLYLDQTIGRMGLLYATAPDRFVAGPSLVAGYPVETTLTFERDTAGQVTGLLWEPARGEARHAAKRVFYTQEPVRFGHDEVSLGGTLLKPLGPGPHPALVMIHGSGPVTRDALMPYADVFVRNGIAVLVHDKRGTGASTGNFARATFDDLASDALSAVEYLKTRPDIDARQIGLQGNSLGGWVAPLAASRSPDIAFVIVESAPATTPMEHERTRVEAQLNADGFTREAIAHALAFMDGKFKVARTGKGWDALMDRLRTGTREGWAPYVNAPTSLDSLQWNWEHVLSYDPAPALEKLTCPVLVLYGELDTVVPLQANRQRMADALKRSGNRDATIKVFEKANHGFFAAMTGGRREGPSLKALVPGYLNTRADWLRQRVRLVTAATITGAPTTAELPASPADGASAATSGADLTGLERPAPAVRTIRGVPDPDEAF
jgi:pimeloyl-ACP methyl ester carboxylesterase